MQFYLSGSLDHQAPEVAAGSEPTQASDIWSLGVLLYQLYAGNKRPVYCTMHVTHVFNRDIADSIWL